MNDNRHMLPEAASIKYITADHSPADSKAVEAIILK